MNFEKARFNMIEQQIRPWEVLTPEVEAQLFSVRRELFVPQRYRNLAFADTQVPLGYGASMLEPGVEARMLNALSLTKSDRAVEVGTGSGFMAALLAAKALTVDTFEIVPELAETAQANLRKAGVGNVAVKTGDGLAEDAIEGSYDVIVLSGSLPLLPQYLTAHLKVGGRMVAIIGDDVGMQVQLIRRDSDAVCTAIPLFETVAPALKSRIPYSTFSL